MGFLREAGRYRCMAMPRQLLILDLDETLVYSTHCSLGRRCSFRVAPYHVYKRPHLKEFLSICTGHFEVAVWTAGGCLYAEEIVKRIFPSHSRPAFVWSSQDCTEVRGAWGAVYATIKDITKIASLGYNVERILVVDDTPGVLGTFYENLIQVVPFTGSPEDNELSLLARYLPSLTTVSDVRYLDKRNWRQGP